MRSIILIGLLISTFFSISAQYYTSGEDPASIRWKQIDTHHFTIVYPSENDADARRLAVILDSIRQVSVYSPNHRPKKFNVLMHGKSAYSNGFVSWAPKRMEIYPTGNSSTYPQDWLEQLGTHEYRHVVQIDWLNQGFTKFLTIPFGQQAVGGILGLHIPLWLLEGDATLSETLLSDAGRGRMSWFEQGLRAQVTQNHIYSYDKAYFGSYNDFVPNYYEMGYHLVTGTNQMYGSQTWVNVLKRTARNSFYPFEFSNAIKKETGRHKVSLYRHVFDSIARQWKTLDAAISATSFTPITLPHNEYRNYLFPHSTADGNIVALMTGPDDMTQFVNITPSGKVTKLFVPGLRDDEEPISVEANHLAWSEYRYDLRWDNAQHSVIRLLDMNTGKARTIGETKGKLFAPSLSPLGDQIAMVNMNDSNNCSIDILQINDEKLIASFAMQRNRVTELSWTNDGKQLVAVILTPRGEKMAILELSRGQWRDLLPPSRTDIRSISVKGNQVAFAAGYTGIENIYTIDMQTGNLQQLTSTRFGGTAPFIDNNQIIYSQYTSNGYQVVKTDVKPLVVNNDTPHSIELYKGLAEVKCDTMHFDYSKANQYKSKPYSKWHLFNFHSWAPAFVDPSSRSVSRGISVMSQNLLNTMTIEAGYNGDSNYQDEKYNLTINWKGWFPQFSLELKAGDTDIKMDGYYSNVNNEVFYLYANANQRHFESKIGISLPFNISRGAYSRKITPSVKYTLNNRSGYDYTQTSGTVLNNQFHPTVTNSVNDPGYHFKALEMVLFGYNLRNGSSRDVATRWGQVIELNHRTNMGSSIDAGSQTALFTRMYWPGIGRHHAIKIENNFQRKFDGEQKTTYNNYIIPYTYSSIVNMPRGFSKSDAQKIYSFAGDYILPLINPDWSMGGVAYIKRIKANLFYDYSIIDKELTSVTNGETTNFHNNYYSCGFELRADMHLFRFIYPIEWGFRQAWLPQTNDRFNEILMSISIN